MEPPWQCHLKMRGSMSNTHDIVTCVWVVRDTKYVENIYASGCRRHSKKCSWQCLDNEAVHEQHPQIVTSEKVYGLCVTQNTWKTFTPPGGKDDTVQLSGSDS